MTGVGPEFNMLNKIAIRTAADDSSMVESQLSTMVDFELEARWAMADAQLDVARRGVEVAIGRLYALLPDRLGDRAALTGAMVARWVEAAVYDLKCLAVEHELPTGGGR
jgi:hypothetical protein